MKEVIILVILALAILVIHDITLRIKTIDARYEENKEEER